MAPSADEHADDEASRLADHRLRWVVSAVCGTLRLTDGWLHALPLLLYVLACPPYGIAKLEAFFLQLLPKPLLTMDQVELLKHDNLPSGDVPGLAELGLVPRSVEAIVPSYLYRYRRGGRLQPSRLG